MRALLGTTSHFCEVVVSYIEDWVSETHPRPGTVAQEGIQTLIVHTAEVFATLPRVLDTHTPDCLAHIPEWWTHIPTPGQLHRESPACIQTPICHTAEVFDTHPRVGHIPIPIRALETHPWAKKASEVNHSEHVCSILNSKPCAPKPKSSTLNPKP